MSAYWVVEALLLVLAPPALYLARPRFPKPPPVLSVAIRADFTKFQAQMQEVAAAAERFARALDRFEQP